MRLYSTLIIIIITKEYENIYKIMDVIFLLVHIGKRLCLKIWSYKNVKRNSKKKKAIQWVVEDQREMNCIFLGLTSANKFERSI